MCRTAKRCALCVHRSKEPHGDDKMTNSMMAYTSVEDLTGTMEVIVFPKVLDTFRDAMHENAVVVIDGRLSVREDEASRLLAESISAH